MSDSVIGNLLKDFMMSDQGKPYALCDQQIARDAITALALYIDSRVDDQNLFLARDDNYDGCILYKGRPTKNGEYFSGAVAGMSAIQLGLNNGEARPILIIK